MVAEVNETGEVTFEANLWASLDGFRLSPDKGAGVAKIKTIKTAIVAAWLPPVPFAGGSFLYAPDTGKI